MSNLIGNPFRSFVTKQINSRQKVLSTTFRDDNFLKYVSKTPWLRMASSIDITDREKAAQLGLQLGSEASQQFVLQGGTIRKAKVDFTCTNLQQFEIINTLYMRPGYDVLIEWGHSVYLNDEEPSQLEQRLDFNTPAFTSFFEGKNTNTLLNNIKW